MVNTHWLGRGLEGCEMSTVEQGLCLYIPGLEALWNLRGYVQIYLDVASQLPAMGGS